MVYCRICKQDKDAKEFIDEDGNYSTRCMTCRFQDVERIKTGPHTPDARKASGRWRIDILDPNKKPTPDKE